MNLNIYLVKVFPYFFFFINQLTNYVNWLNFFPLCISFKTV